MATDVTYNGVTLHNVATREWVEDVVRDDSGTDVIRHKFRMRFDGLIHGGTGEPSHIKGPAQANLPGTNPTANIIAIRERLKAPRQELTVTVGGQVLLTCKPPLPPDIDADVNSGPKPSGVTVTQVVGSLCYRVSFTIECEKVECYGGGGTTNFVLSNRWGVTEMTGATGYTTRHIRGNLVLSSLDAGHAAKRLCIPFLEPGFARQSIEFGVDASGLKCSYSITDTQVHTAAPWPVRVFSAVYQAESTYGFTWDTSINCRVEGGPEASKTLLLVRAMEIAERRLAWEQYSASNQFIPTSIVIVEHIGAENVIELMIKGKVTWITQLQTAVMKAGLKEFGAPLEFDVLDNQPTGQYSTAISTPFETYGTNPNGGARDPAALAFLACYYQQPCGGPHAIANGTVTTSDAGTPSETESLPEPTQSAYTELPPATESALSTQHSEAMYTYARAESTYETRYLRAQMPIAQAGSLNVPGDTCVVVTLGPAVCRRIIRVSCERTGAWPRIPEAADTYQDAELSGVLLEHTVMPMPPTVSAVADATRLLYRLDATYVYAMNRPPGPADVVHVGQLPFLNFEAFHGSVDLEQVYDSTLGPGPSA